MTMDDALVVLRSSFITFLVWFLSLEIFYFSGHLTVDPKYGVLSGLGSHFYLFGIWWKSDYKVQWTDTVMPVWMEVLTKSKNQFLGK